MIDGLDFVIKVLGFMSEGLGFVSEGLGCVIEARASLSELGFSLGVEFSLGLGLEAIRSVGSGLGQSG